MSWYVYIAPTPEMFFDFFALVILEAVIGLPALPKDSGDWKRRRKRFIVWFVVALIIVGTITVLTFLNTYGIV